MIHNDGSSHFEAELTFHFAERDENRRDWFLFGEDLYRRVPMEFDGVDGLNTVELLAERSGKFCAGDTVHVKCRVISPELFGGALALGASFRLWDGYFFADGSVVAICETSTDSS